MKNWLASSGLSMPTIVANTGLQLVSCPAPFMHEGLARTHRRARLGYNRAHNCNNYVGKGRQQAHAF